MKWPLFMARISQVTNGVTNFLKIISPIFPIILKYFVKYNFMTNIRFFK